MRTANCRCEGECLCARRIVAEHSEALRILAGHRCPPHAMCLDCFFADLERPVAECHPSRCKQFPDLPCKCRTSPEIAEPGEW